MCLRFARLNASKEHRSIKIDGSVGPNMFDPTPAIRAEAVEAQAISRRIDLANQASAQCNPLRRFDLALENRLLDALAEIKTGTGDAPQTPASGCCLCVHVIGDEHQHADRHFHTKAG